MKRPAMVLLILLHGSLAIAEPEQQAGADPAQNPLLQRLQNLQQMRLRFEEDMAAYLGNARAISGSPSAPPTDAPTIGQMRQQVAGKLERLEDRFRCLDVDIKGNNGNVVLVCGDNYGPVSTNNQQAFGADLNAGAAR